MTLAWWKCERAAFHAMHPASASRGSRHPSRLIRRVEVAGTFSIEYHICVTCLKFALRIRRQMVESLRVVPLKEPDYQLLSGTKLNGYRLLRSRI
jgi:hypothetical protein